MKHANITVLLVEDNPADARLLKELVIDLPMVTMVTFIHSEQLAQALARLDDGGIDIILLDLSLPDSRGLEGFIRLHSHAPSVPIIILTGANDAALAIQSLQQGAQDYLVKGETDGNLLIRSLTYALERAHTLKALQESEARFALFMRHLPGVAFIKDAQGRYTFINEAGKSLYGWIDDIWQGKTDDDLFPPEIAAQFKDNDRMVLASRAATQVVEIFPRDSGIHYHLVSKFPIFAGHGGEILIGGIAVDITERRQAEERLHYQASHDALTGLPNRAMFIEQLRYAFERAKRCPEHRFAVFFVDLDRFKFVNDSLGHLIGDELLIAVARRLDQSLRRPADVVARLGGDEFAILIDDLRDVGDTAIIADRLQHVMTEPFGLSGQLVRVSASIGIATNLIIYEHPEDLLRDADTALHYAKVSGKARYELFDVSMHRQMLASLQIETDLQHAIDAGELLLYYQPIVTLANKAIVGFEALLRWQHPQRGLLAPGEFLSVAEETGLIVPMGRWAINEACRQLRAWQLSFPHHLNLTVSVNLSSRQFAQLDLAEYIDQALQETGLDAHSLKLEITETVIMENMATATTMLERLHARGLQLYMDDFGTGYSSLSYLQRFPIDMIKIDRSFVMDIGAQQKNEEIIRMIVALAQALRMQVVAEGIEREDQLICVRALGCVYGQGYFFSRPVSPERVEEMLREA